ncbi:MAG TPA: DUF2637 domain-containing protein [Micromonospora sp.]|nr:DUF2637 domain-containing protein [Micromonospora sp.]
MDVLIDYHPPRWLVAVLAAVSLLLILVGLPLARRAGRIGAERLRYPENYANWRERAKDRALFLSALLPSILVWLSVMGVSFRGLVGFATDYMGWNDWTNVIVPLSLDGISVAFGAHAFRSVKRGRFPGRARRIVFAAAAASAVLNYVHAAEAWSIWAGVYLAFMSIVGMLMFHEMLDQFSDAEADEQLLRSKTPRFGTRWLLAPFNTFLVWRMWIYDPPADLRSATVRNALDHYSEVQARKRQRTRELADLKSEERRAQIARNAELVQARRAARRGGATAPPAPAVVNQPPATERTPATVTVRQGREVNGQRGNSTLMLNGDGRPTPVAAELAPSRPEQVAVTVPMPPPPVRKTAVRGAINPRALAARWAPEAKRLAAEKLSSGERVTGPMLRALIAQRAAAEDGGVWQPSDAWARTILREVRTELEQRAPVSGG